MLPDFPNFKNKLNRGTYRFLTENFHKTGLLSMTKKKILFEGNGFSFQREDDNLKNEEDVLKEMTGKFEIKNDDLLVKGPIAYIEGMLGVIEELNGKGEVLVINKMQEATEKSGNIVRSKDKFTPDTILEMFEKISMSFDENGNHELFFVSGDDSFDEALTEFRTNPEYIEKYQKLIEKKRQEWNDRENNRKLVD